MTTSKLKEISIMQAILFKDKDWIHPAPDLLYS